MTDRSMSSQQQDQLEALVDACGLDLVLGGLADICAAKSDYVLTNWQDRSLADAWMRAMTKIDVASTVECIKEVSQWAETRPFGRIFVDRSE
jgi:hypothetical protein